MTMNTFDLEQLTKTNLAKMAAFLGEKGDWARVSKDDIIALIDNHTIERQVAALVQIGATPEDIENMRIGEGEIPAAGDAINAMMEAEAAPAAPGTGKTQASSTAPRAAAPADADQVGQIAALLAQVLATNKGALDRDAVAAIAAEQLGPMLGQFEQGVADQLAGGHARLLEALERRLADMPARKIDVTSKTGTVTIEGRQHQQFEQLLKVLGSTNAAGNSNLNVWLTGMPGTGKTHASSAAAAALGMAFYCNGSIANKYELTGFVDAHGKLVRTPFRDAWENGGLYLFDEVDGSVPSAVLAFNSALANGIMAFPDGMLKRHPDCIIIAAANTAGQGATAELVGRMKQDAAFLDRFVFMNWAIDEGLETHLCQNKDWAAYVQGVRRKVSDKGVKVMVTPRASFFGDQLLSTGISNADVIAMTLKKGMSTDQWNLVK